MVRTRLFISLIIIGISIQSCSKDEEYDFTDIEIYGHGGAGFESFLNTTPPNSFESIQKAIEVLAADGVEVDVQIDKNGKLWLYHDELLESKTNCSGCMGDLNSEYISSCSYSKKRPVYSLAELIAYCSTMEPKPKISIQAQILNRCEVYEPLGNAIYQVVNTNNAFDWIQVESDSRELLILLKDSSSQFQLFFDGSDVNADLSFCINHNLTGLIMFNDDVTFDDIQLVKSSGLKIGLYGVKNQWQIESALYKLPDQIQTDNIALMNRIMYD